MRISTMNRDIKIWTMVVGNNWEYREMIGENNHEFRQDLLCCTEKLELGLFYKKEKKTLNDKWEETLNSYKIFDVETETFSYYGCQKMTSKHEKQ